MKALWLIPAGLVGDQLTKLVVMRTMVRGESVPVLGDLFRLTYIHNSGAAFGLNLGSAPLHTAISVGALAALAYLYRTAPADGRLMRFSLCLVLGGALGNIIDRIRLNEVVDFLDFGLGSLRWPVFNLADSLVSVGIFLLALAYWRHGQEAPSRQHPADPLPPQR